MTSEEKIQRTFLCIGDMTSNIIHIYELFIFKLFYGATRQKWQISKVYTDVNQIYDFN